jgi:hypothetical protein
MDLPFLRASASDLRDRRIFTQLKFKIAYWQRSGGNGDVP